MRGLASPVIWAQHPPPALHFPSSLIAGKSPFCVFKPYYRSILLHFSPFYTPPATVSHSTLSAMVDTRRAGARKPTRKAYANKVTKSRSRGTSARGQRRRRSPSPAVPSLTPPRSHTSKDAIDVEQAELRRNIDDLLAYKQRNTETARLRAEFARLQGIATPPSIPRYPLPAGQYQPAQGYIPAPPAIYASERTSFTHLQGIEPPPIDILTIRFPAVNPKHIRQIYHCSFKAEDLPKLNDNIVAQMAMSKDDTVELKDIINLLSCFEVYAQIVCFFAHPAVALPLQEAFASYRSRLLYLSVIYTWKSLRAFHLAFVYTRIARGQDDVAGWKTIERSLEGQVLLRRPPRTDPRPSAGLSTSAKYRPFT